MPVQPVTVGIPTLPIGNILIPTADKRSSEVTQADVSGDLLEISITTDKYTLKVAYAFKVPPHCLRRMFAAATKS